MTEVEKVEQFIRELRSRHVVCLYPIIWNDFFLYFKRRLRNTLELPNPLVLGGWSASNDYDKRERFEEHIRLISRVLKIKTSFFKGDYFNPTIEFVILNSSSHNTSS